MRCPTCQSCPHGLDARCDVDLFWYRRHVDKGAGLVREDDNMDESIPAEVLLDENELAEGHPGFNLGGFEVHRLPPVLLQVPLKTVTLTIGHVMEPGLGTVGNYHDQHIGDPTLLLSISLMQVSADHRRLACAVDLTGKEQYDLYFKDVDTGEVSQLTKVGAASGSIAWALDNSTLFYVTLVCVSRSGLHAFHSVPCTVLYCQEQALGPIRCVNVQECCWVIDHSVPLQTAQTQRPNKVWRASTNDTSASPELLYEEPDEAFSLSLSQTHSQQHILLYGESMTTKYAMSLSSAQPEGNLYFAFIIRHAHYT